MAVVVVGKFVYLATPHTASTSTARALLTLPGAVPKGGHHATFGELGDDVRLPRVTGIRNPFDMIATWWLRTDARRRHATFKDFLREYDDPTYVRDGRIFYHCGPGVRVLRFENLADDFARLLRDHGLPQVELPWVNRTVDRRPWPEYYDDEARAVVWSRFGDEIREHGYGG